MIQQLFLDSRYADHVFSDGTCLHWLGSPIHARRGTFLNVRVIDAWISVSFFNVFESNSSITFTYGASEVQNLIIPHGNRDIDFVVNFLNDNMLYDYVASYDSARNEVVLSSGTVPIRAGKSEFLGFADGDASGPPVQGLYTLTATKRRQSMPHRVNIFTIEYAMSESRSGLQNVVNDSREDAARFGASERDPPLRVPGICPTFGKYRF